MGQNSSFTKYPDSDLIKAGENQVLENVCFRNYDFTCARGSNGTNDNDEDNNTCVDKSTNNRH